ncbi:carboxypeptidase-like regulatory domain-containing protein, partial [Bacteroides heparinolyticus]
MKQVNLRICRTILPLFLGLFLSVSTYAQSITVVGNVKDATGEPVIGANVLVKGTATGIITDLDGKFQLQAPQGATLVV